MVLINFTVYFRSVGECLLERELLYPDRVLLPFVCSFGFFGLVSYFIWNIFIKAKNKSLC